MYLKKNDPVFAHKNLSSNCFVFPFQRRFFSILLEDMNHSEQLLYALHQPELQEERRRLLQRTKFLKRLLRIYRESYCLQQRFKFHKLFSDSVKEVEQLVDILAGIISVHEFSSDSESDSDFDLD